MIDGTLVLAVLMAKGIISQEELEGILWAMVVRYPEFEAEQAEHAVLRAAEAMKGAVRPLVHS